MVERLCAPILRGAIAVAAGFSAGCGSGDPRTGEIASVLARADEPLIRTRPELVAGKYALMAEDPYSFFRGTVPLFLHDFTANHAGLGASRFALTAPLVVAIGDAHVENFGALRGADGLLAIEPNDFDGADRTVYLWDVRRLVTAMSVAARLSNDDDPDARAAAAEAAKDISYSAARAYAETIAALAGGAPRARVTEALGSEVYADVFERSEEDGENRAELQELTILEGGSRRLRRGVVDPEEPEHVFLDAPATARAALPAALAGYRETLADPPPQAFFTVLDAVREKGTGVASWPRVRILVLVRGPSDEPSDDVLLELKEVADSTVPRHAPPQVSYDSIQERILGTSRAAWGVPDTEPLWGMTAFLGFPAQVRLESAGQKTIRVRRLRKKRGTVPALSRLAADLGALVARVHASPWTEGAESPAAAIAGVIGGEVEGFAEEQASVGAAYGLEVLADHERFGDALRDLGPRLGVRFDPRDEPSPDLAALYEGVTP